MSITAKTILDFRHDTDITTSRKLIKSEPRIRGNLWANLLDVADMVHQREYDLASITTYVLAMCDRFADSPLWKKTATEHDVLVALANAHVDVNAFAARTNNRSDVLADLVTTFVETKSPTDRDALVATGLLCLALEDDLTSVAA